MYLSFSSCLAYLITFFRATKAIPLQSKHPSRQTLTLLIIDGAQGHLNNPTYRSGKYSTRHLSNIAYQCLYTVVMSCLQRCNNC
ncbi:hypothetical protein BDV40DRAFT_270845 [Aspergillus tamarii]|uniref:Secreted protein n=1 Tax=Aspergillus tamarii TaxID=41984 RepID=A0A5N6UNW7_ASPTM|nr:hypothetical protein BDV40DRAFT_270845 [Aspergillus tamarii]